MIVGLCVFAAGGASAEWCDPPTAPALTTTELAKDFRAEFTAEFDDYFRAASRYAACLDAERVRIFDEMRFTVERYERFLADSEEWD